jgi:hypothetical protein
MPMSTLVWGSRGLNRWRWERIRFSSGVGWGRFSFNAPVLKCIGDHWKFEKKESRIISESSTICIQTEVKSVVFKLVDF